MREYQLNLFINLPKISRQSKAWDEEMKRDKFDGNQKKDVANQHYEAVKLKDLDYLKACGGPFTTSENFMKDTEESKQKNKRFYVEVRYAKNTCMSLKYSASVFRLKRAYKYLESTEYTENLKEYFGDSRNKSMLTMNDLTFVLRRISGTQQCMCYFLYLITISGFHYFFLGAICIKRTNVRVLFVFRCFTALCCCVQLSTVLKYVRKKIT